MTYFIRFTCTKPIQVTKWQHIPSTYKYETKQGMFSMKRKELTKLTNEWRNFINETSRTNPRPATRQSASHIASGSLPAEKADDSKTMVSGELILTLSEKFEEGYGGIDVDLTGSKKLRDLNTSYFLNMMDIVQLNKHLF